VGVPLGVVVSVGVGVGVPVGVPVSVELGLLLGVAVAVFVGLGLLLGLGLLEGLGLLLGVGLLLGLGVFVGVGDGDGLGDRGSCSTSHCVPVPLAVAASAVADDGPSARDVPVWAADAAMEKPAAVVRRTPPVTRLTLTGRACAKRMSAPASAVRCCLRNDLFSMEWLDPSETPGLDGTPTIGHHARARRHCDHYPVGTGLIVGRNYISGL
jgi:hypothetical protein